MENQQTQGGADNKARITITLKQSLLPLLDHFIDGDRIRNRSHAIEYILSQNLGLGMNTAVILAGGDESGTVDAMRIVAGKPGIAWTLDLLQGIGVRSVILVIDEHGMDLKNYIGEGAQWKMKVTYVKDADKKGTAHALAMVKPLIDESFLLIYGDILSKISLGDFIEHHQTTEHVGTVALTYSASISDFGVARMQGSQIVDYTEKPGQDAQHGLVNAGMYIFEPHIFQFLDGAESLERDVLPTVAKAGQLSGYPFDAAWYDLSNQKDLATANLNWK